MRKTFKFDKVAYTSKRRVNLPTIEMELEYKNNDTSKPILSICGCLWNATHTDIVIGGQCLDELNKFSSLKCNPLFKKLYRLWKLYHLNDMHAGTVKQEQALNNYCDPNRYYSYDEQCKYLESIGLLVDDGYKYGSSWLYWPIPDEDLKEIESLYYGE